MKKVYVLTWDDEYRGLLHSFKAYPTREKAEQAIEEYINSHPNKEYQEHLRHNSDFLPEIHELEICY